MRQLLKLGEILQWIWRALAFLSVPVLIGKLQVATSELDDPAAGWRIIVCTIVVCAFQCRWAIGNDRYLTEAWGIRPAWANLSLKEPAFHRAVIIRFFCDLALMVVHAAILCWMATSIALVPRFITALICLLVSDCLWLPYNLNVWPCWVLLLITFCRDLFRGRRNSIRVMKPAAWVEDYAPRIWTWTNLATAVVLLLLRRYAQTIGIDGTEASLVAMGVVAVTNSYVDFRETQFGLSGGG